MFDLSALPERLTSKFTVAGPDECWLWTAGLHSGSGYSWVQWNGRSMKGHVVLYELLVGPVPSGLILDHTCHTRAMDTCPKGLACPHRRCVNPAHLEPVTNEENLARGGGLPSVNRAKTHCKWGHPFSPENTRRTPDGTRQCITCRRAAQQEHCRRVMADPVRQEALNARQREARHQAAAARERTPRVSARAGMVVRPGQIWADTDKRNCGRKVRVVEIAASYAIVELVVGGRAERWAATWARRTRIRLDRFREIRGNYRLISDVE